MVTASIVPLGVDDEEPPSGVRDAAIRVITDHGEIPCFPLADKDVMDEVVDASKRHGRPIEVVISDLL